MLFKKNLCNILSIRKSSEKNRSLDLNYKSAISLSKEEHCLKQMGTVPGNILMSKCKYFVIVHKWKDIKS